MSYRVHILVDLERETIDDLRRQFNSNIVLTVGNDATDLSRCHALIAGVVDEAALKRCPSLEALIIPWAGLPQRTAEALRGFPNIKVYNVHHNAAATAETALALMLAAAKGIVPIDRQFRTSDWTPRYLPQTSVLLNGMTALIIGFGAIGRRLAVACRSLGMNVRAIRRSPSVESSEVELYLPEDLRKLLPEADVLFICVPHTPETRGMIGALELALLPDRSILVNVARGPVVEEAALFAELRRRRIRAGLDVWYQYPSEPNGRSEQYPSAFPFHKLDNVVMTPHLGGNADGIEEHRARELSLVLNALAGGREPDSRVDLDRGY
jgi:phosphoglycerate dehydrogenase-like enzyme